jgi:uncharacterized protein (TIGR03435 family)
MSRRLICFSSILLALAVNSGAASAQLSPAETQTASPAAPVFDVAAIHTYIPQPHDHSHIWILPNDSHFKAQNVSLVALIHWAFDMPETRILSAPEWAGTARFAIDAEAGNSVDDQMHKMTQEAARAEQKKMVQSLLADRFRLAMHDETRERPIYLLKAAKDGPKLGTPDPSGAFINHGRNYIEINGYTNGVSTLAEELSKEVGRDVVDQTGITGRYHLKLTWATDDRSAPEAGGTDPSLTASDSGPSIFTALEEQLGLRLEPAKGPVKVLVVDHVEMPSAN